jgi:hypothetical protein
MSLILTILLRIENKKRLRGMRNGWTTNMSEKEIHKLGDMKCVLFTQYNFGNIS